MLRSGPPQGPQHADPLAEGGGTEFPQGCGPAPERGAVVAEGLTGEVFGFQFAGRNQESTNRLLQRAQGADRADAEDEDG